MLQKINRIKKKKDFELIFKQGKSFKNNLFILKFIKNDLHQNRIGFVVSQKVSKKATIRNKIRRRLTEIIKPEMEKMDGQTDVVLIALHGIEKKEFSELRESLTWALVKAKITNK